jgi:hypothetical protein
MARPTKPTAPAQALRSSPDTFAARAEAGIDFAFTTLPTYINAALIYAETQVDAASDWGRAFGLGVIGDAPVLTAINATNTASGTYSYTTGATGTLPSGVTAATGGVIKVERQSATKGYMTLQPTGSTDLYSRNLSTTWGAWIRVASTAYVDAAAAATAASAGEVLLGTLTTTSGTAQTLSGLVLTDYSTLRIVAFGVSFTATAQLTLGGSTSYLAASVASSANLYGQAVLDLSTGIASSAIAVITAFAGVVTAYASFTGYSNASTSISFGGGTFDAGTIYVYGVK